jgi:hypothetical protein
MFNWNNRLKQIAMTMVIPSVPNGNEIRTPSPFAQITANPEA